MYRSRRIRRRACAAVVAEDHSDPFPASGDARAPVRALVPARDRSARRIARRPHAIASPRGLTLRTNARLTPKVSLASASARSAVSARAHGALAPVGVRDGGVARWSSAQRRRRQLQDADDTPVRQPSAVRGQSSGVDITHSFVRSLSRSLTSAATRITSAFVVWFRSCRQRPMTSDFRRADNDRASRRTFGSRQRFVVSRHRSFLSPPRGRHSSSA